MVSFIQPPEQVGIASYRYVPPGLIWFSVLYGHAWKVVLFEDYSCPQCRYSFDSKPDLKKNTLLSNLVSQLIAVRGDDSDGKEEVVEEEEKKIDPNVVICDQCMKESAVMTCLTCMISYCSEHLQPHLESPAFRDHNLKQPLRDLQQRKCAEHNKLLDCYCWEHAKCICCNCLASHKQCHTNSLNEGKAKKELLLKNLRQSLNQKIEKASNTSDEVKIEQKRVLEITKKKKSLIQGEFEEIKALIEEEQKKAIKKIEEEEKKVNSKFTYTQSVLGKKKKEYQTMKDKVEALLEEEDDLQFLKSASKVQDTTSKEPFKPKTEFDENLLHQIYRNTVSLKDVVKMKINNIEDTQDWKVPTSAQTKHADTEKPSFQSENAEWRSHPGANKFPEAEKQPKKGENAEWRSHPGANKFPEAEKQPKKDDNPEWRSYQGENKFPEAEKKPKKAKQKMNKSPAGAAAAGSGTTPTPPNVRPRINISIIPISREEALKYVEHLTVDPNTAHRRVIMTDGYTKLTVSDTPQNYIDNPQRFANCSQVLCSRGFSQGIHYWEVDVQGGNFSGIGVAYMSISRRGTESRLGRNKCSWCIEWFNGKLQAWHDDKLTDLASLNTNKIGVLLNNDVGTVCFFSVGKTFTQIYRFRAKFTEPVYPAFWVFSSNTVLCLSLQQ